MANLNKVHLIGRLTRDPESRTFANGGKVCNFGFAVTGSRRKNQQGQWEDEPCFLDVKAFNRDQGIKLADLCEQYLRKGHQAYIEGHLVLERWQAQDGSNRQALKIVADQVQFLQPKDQGQTQAQPAGRPAQQPSRGHNPEADDPIDGPPAYTGAEDIPF